MVMVISHILVAYRNGACAWCGFVSPLQMYYALFTSVFKFIILVCDMGRDRLSLRQHEWLRILAQTGVKVEICHVSCD